MSSSSQVKNGQQTEIQSVETLIFSGLKSRLHEVFDTPVVFLNSTDEMQAAKKLMVDGAVRYPLMFLSITQMAPSRSSWRATPLLRRGIDFMPSTDGKNAKKVQLMPVDITFDVKYKHNSFIEILKFAKRWLFSARAGYLKFNITYGQVSFPIHIALTEEITVPKREANPDTIAEFEFPVSLVVQGWMSEEKLQDQAVAIEMNITSYMQELGAAPGAQLMLFKSTWTGSTIE